MSRTLVIDKGEDTRFPFLRGILTRSLQDSGLSFEQAYKLATVVRDELRDVDEISVEDLRAKVLKKLEAHGKKAIDRYLRPVMPTSILIRYADGHTSPFSRGRHRLGLASCGLAGEDALVASARIYEDLLARGKPEIASSALRHLTYRHLVTDLGEHAGKKYLVWQEFKRSHRPLVIIVGGGVGSGKSTLAAQIAHRLEIVRIQSTDMLREVMRLMVPARLLPVLHESSFNAWRQLPQSDWEDTDPQKALITGYLTQADLASVACEAVIHRAMRERVSLILEGVHAHPQLLPELENDTDAIIVRIVLGVLKKNALRARIKGRGKKEPDRRAKRYLKHFDEIWSLQSFMLSEADEIQVPIVENEELDSTVLQVMEIIMERLASQFSGTPEEVF
jgi:2-phosphoglycerate kinase